MSKFLLLAVQLIIETIAPNFLIGSNKQCFKMIHTDDPHPTDNRSIFFKKKKERELCFAPSICRLLIKDYIFSMHVIECNFHNSY